MITLNPLIFGTVVTITNLKNKELNNKLLKFCKKLKKTSGRNISNVGGFQSNFVNQDDPLIKEFFNYTKQHILNYTNVYEIDGLCDPTLHGAWFNVNKKGDYNKQHSHISGEYLPHLSAVYYLKTSKNCGKLCFVNPDQFINVNPFFQKKLKFFNPFNSPEYLINPKEMDLIIFPSSLSHYVEPNTSSEERISLAFNIKV